MTTYPPTPRTTPHRNRDRLRYEREAIHAVLDEGWFAQVSFVINGAPMILPLLHVRIDDALYVHASTGGGMMLAAREPGGMPICVSVTLLDGLVYARSHFHHSANYRAVIAHGEAHLVTDQAEKLRALTAMVDKLGAGRADDCRPPNTTEFAQTGVLRLDLAEVSLKVRAGGPSDDPADEDLPHWAGVVPIATVLGAPISASTMAPPAYLPGPGTGPGSLPSQHDEGAVRP